MTDGIIMGRADSRNFALLNHQGVVTYEFKCESIQSDGTLVCAYDSDNQIKVVINLGPGQSVVEVYDIT